MRGGQSSVFSSNKSFILAAENGQVEGDFPVFRLPQFAS